MLTRSLSATLIALVAVALCTGSAVAQEGTISGTVVDSSTTETIPGVNVVVQELETGAATDAQGMFRLTDVPSGSYTLSVSYVGYQQKSVPVEVEGGETTNVRIELARSAVELEDVVVTALGIEREQAALGYAVEEVQGADLEESGESNFISTLTGKVAGAQIRSSNQMGGSARITIRGPGSLSGNNQPLIVVDGVPLDNSSFNSLGQDAGFGGYDYGNAAGMINPSDIKSVSVLKGASAAALYGSRAADGVIQITTKGGQEGDGIGVSFQTSVEATSLYGFPNYQNKYGGGASPNFFENEDGQLVADFGTDQSWGPRLDGREVREWFSYDDVNNLNGRTTPWDAHPNNVENFFKTGATWNTNIALSQGGENYSYRVTLKNEMTRGNSPESEMERRNVSFNGSLDFTENLSTTVSANYIDIGARGRPGSGYTNANGPWLQFNHFGQRQIDLSDDAPMQDIARPDGTQRSWNWENSGLGSDTAPQDGEIIYANNPYWIRRKNYQNDDKDRLYGKVEVSYDILENLTASANVRTDYYTTRQQERVAIGSVGQASYEEDVRETQETNFGGQVKYAGQLTEQVSMNATGGVNYRYSQLSRNFAATRGGLAVQDLFTLENSVGRPSINDHFQEQALVGVYGDVSLGYNEMVFVGGTLRNDWSSTLPAGNNTYLYPSANASFVFSRLPALQESELLTFGKIRVNWSQVGRDTDPYQLSFAFPLDDPFGSTQLQSLPNTLPNPGLKPEIKTGWEVGTQLQFFDNRLGLDATYYSEETRNQILAVEGSGASGYRQRLANAGTIANKGVELSLNTTPVQMEQFQWDFRVNWAKNVNEVVDLADEVTSIPLNPEAAGPPFGPDVIAREGEEYGSFFGPGFARTDDGKKILSPAGFYQTTGPKVLGSYLPDWTGGVSTTLSYRGVSASVLVDGQKGGQIWSLSNLFGMYSGIFGVTASKNIRQLGLLPEGVRENGEPFEDCTLPVRECQNDSGSASGPAKSLFQDLFGNHEAHLYDASYIKLREVNVSYTMPRQWFATTPIQGLTASLYGRNLATLLKYTPNFDPTAVTRGSSNIQGIETGQMPPRRAIGFRVRLSF